MVKFQLYQRIGSARGRLPNSLFSLLCRDINLHGTRQHRERKIRELANDHDKWKRLSALSATTTTILIKAKVKVIIWTSCPNIFLKEVHFIIYIFTQT